MIITFPLIGLYSILLQAKEKVKDLSRFVFIALIINITLNYFLIINLIGLGESYAVMGVSIATIVSRGVLLFSLILITNKYYKINYDLALLLKVLVSTGIMILSLTIFRNHLNKMDILFGIITIVLGVVIYFTSMFILKGITKEDFKLLRHLFKK